MEEGLALPHRYQCTVVLRIALDLQCIGSLAFSMVTPNLVDQDAGSGFNLEDLFWNLISVSQAWCPEGSMSSPDSGTCWRAAIPTQEPVERFLP